jgi:uncharacterized protein YbaR (Trm112 family)
VSLDPQLLEILACPDAHHAPLAYDPDAEKLTCTGCGRVFPVEDDIPTLMPVEASAPGGAVEGTGTAAEGGQRS